MKFVILLLFFHFALLYGNDSNEPENPFSIGGLAFISYDAIIDDGKVDENLFNISRAYIDLKKEIADYMDFRLTLDTYKDDDGHEKRIKYMYAQFHIPGYGIADNLRFKVGIIHTPWLEFQSKYYKYRVQGTLFMENIKIFDSSDLGAILSGDLTNSDKTAKIASYLVGLYNGSGYKGFEINSNKVIKLITTVYPLWEILPDLQLSYFHLNGESNISNTLNENNWIANSIYSSYKNKHFTISAEYIFGKGNQNGTLINNDNYPDKYTGYSFFGEYHLNSRFSLMGRYDNIEPYEMKDYSGMDRLITGVAYNINKNSFLLLDYEREFYNDFDNPEKETLKLSLMIKFADIVNNF